MHQIPDLVMISPMKSNLANDDVKTIEINGVRAGQRLDNYLNGYFRGVPKSVIYRLVRTGQVRINSGRVKPGYRLQAGDRIRIPPGIKQAPDAGVNPLEIKALVSKLNDAILLNTEEFIVLNKPSGIAVHGGSGLRFGLIEALRTDPVFAELELVHRLDRETSGCLVLARSRGCLLRLHELLRDKQVEKRYTALLKGRLESPVVIDAELSRQKRGNERMVTATANKSGRSKTALSRIEPVHLYRDATLASIKIDTGRTHQIRVHSASIGHALAGDAKYGDREFNKKMRKLGLNRLFLHAHGVRFKLDQVYQCEAPLPHELQKILDHLNGA